MGNCCAASPDGKQRGLEQLNGADQLIATEDLPPGWKAVPSRSRPGKVAYQNIHTGERISWIPKEPAATFKGAIKKKKKQKKRAGDSAAHDKLLSEGEGSESQQANNVGSEQKPVATTELYVQ